MKGFKIDPPVHPVTQEAPCSILKIGFQYCFVESIKGGSLRYSKNKQPDYAHLVKTNGLVKVVGVNGNSWQATIVGCGEFDGLPSTANQFTPSRIVHR